MAIFLVTSKVDSSFTNYVDLTWHLGEYLPKPNFVAVLRKTVYNLVLPFRTNRYLPSAASKQYSWWEFLLVEEQRKVYIRQQGYVAFSKLSIVQAYSMTHSY